MRKCDGQQTATITYQKATLLVDCGCGFHNIFLVIHCGQTTDIDFTKYKLVGQTYLVFHDRTSLKINILDLIT